jgi:hypothetical protein
MHNVVAIFKNEAPYLAEWIQFHRLQGFDNFFLYDNDSTDKGAKIAALYGANVIPWPGPVQQISAYQHALRTLPAGEWAAFIDIDEYLWSPSGKPVVELLPEGLRRRPRALGVPWLMFGTNYHKTMPVDLTISAYTRREKGINNHVKQIMRVNERALFLDPHHTNVVFQRAHPYLMCNHYWTRSVEEMHVKCARGRADLSRPRSINEFLDVKDSHNAVEDRRVADRWADKLQEALIL